MDQDSDVVMPEEFREIPLSGSFEERDFGRSGLRCWVKFTDSQYMEWCGKFEPGAKAGKRKILWLPGTREFFILASGRGYIVNADTRELLATTKSDMLEDAIVVPEQNVVAVTNGFTIALFDSSGDIWESEHVALDGIAFHEVVSDRVTGKLYGLSDAWHDFTFDVGQRRIESAWSFADSFRPAPVSQLRLAKIVVATFGAAVTVLGLAIYWLDRDVYGVLAVLLGVLFMLAAAFGAGSPSKRSRGFK